MASANVLLKNSGGILPIQAIEAAVAAPSELELRATTLVEQALAYRMSVHDEIPPEHCVLSVNGVPFFAKGDIHGIKAKQKQGKTTAISLMAAAILGCDRFAPKAILPTDEAGEERAMKVIFFDTEQKKQDTKLFYERVLTLADMPLDEDSYDQLQVYPLRQLDTDELLPTIETIIRHERPDVAFIDGVVDLMGDFNDLETSKELIRKLLQLATECDCAIVNVLHTNKDKDDNNMRGHLGTILAQKAGNVLECTKKGSIFTVSSADSRHQEVPSWSFMFADDSSIVDGEQALRQMEAQAQQDKKEKQEDDRLQRDAARREAVFSIINQHHGRVSRSTLMDELGNRIQRGPTTIKGILTDLKNEGAILETNGYITIPNLSMFPRP